MEGLRSLNPQVPKKSLKVSEGTFPAGQRETGSPPAPALGGSGGSGSMFKKKRAYTSSFLKLSRKTALIF